jgi:hypothetical protein
MGGQDIAGEPDQVVAVMGDICDNGAGLSDTVSGPVEFVGVQGHDRTRDLRTGCTCSCALIQS